MECTQRLECTQELYDTHTERVCPEQIGFLGICGAKHPVLRGPNKIGRDPQTCSIVLNLNSVSRQHAVINVLNSKEYMLMDLDSANKTKLLNKTLQPYIPHPIRNGDTVQFGDIFGIFRLLEEDDELPMTQALDIPATPVPIPETPVPTRQISKLTKATTTMIPESPDVSDKEDSFVTPSQPKNEKTRLSSGQFIKPFGKSIAIHPISSPKTDTSRDSSKRTISFLDSPNTSLNKSNINVDKKPNDIYEMDTQPPYPVTNPNESTDSIYTADTQIPPGHEKPLSIHTLDTQLPTTENLPQVCKINDQQDMQFDIYAANKENDLSIFNAETQPFTYEKDESLNKSKLEDKVDDIPKKVLNTSNDEILFDELDEGCFENFNSQPLLPQESPKREETASKSDHSTDCEDIDMIATQKVEELPKKKEPPKAEEKIKPTASKRAMRIASDSSTDCEDIEFMPTQKIPELPKVNVTTKESEKNKAKTVTNDDDLTDCEDIDLIPTQKIPEKKPNVDEDLTDCEDDFIELNPKAKETVKDTKVDFEDMPTQVIDIDPEKIDKPAFEDMDTQIVGIDENAAAKCNDDSFEDQATQIIEEIPNDSEAAKKSFKEIISPFKIPLQSPIRVKSKDIPKVRAKDKAPIVIEDDNYYNATQDILDDLCTQRDDSPVLELKHKSRSKNKSPLLLDDDIVSCSVEDYKTKDILANIDKDLSPTKPTGDQRKKNQEHLSNQDVRDIIGVEPSVSKPKKFPSDSSSDVESTPKKVRTFVFTDSDFPNSQEIKTNMFVNNSKSYATESSSESEPEVNSEDQYTPLVHKTKKVNKVVKIDLTKKFEAQKLPERIITRVRKPTAKMEENMQTDKKASTSMLKPKFFTEQEDQINEEIIQENVKRLKNYGKVKSGKTDNKPNEENNDETKAKIETKPSEVKITTPPEAKNKINALKEKIKVKIEKPKPKKDNKESKPKTERTTRKSKEESARSSRHKSPATKTNEDKRKSDEIEKSKPKEDNLLSKSDTKVNPRVTRSRRRGKDSKISETKSISPEKDKKEPLETKRKRYTKKKEEPKESVSPEMEIRRSKRQAKAKSDSQNMDPPKSILKKSILEQSTVYNVSSGGESPKGVKRSLGDDNEVPSPKRTRAFVNNSTISNASLRATPARTLKTQNVLLTAFPSNEVKTKLEKLGAVIVTDVMECSVVLTMQVKRTFKLLCAVGLGRPIVGPSWVQACVDTHMIVDPWLYLVKDEAAEKRFQFNLERTLNGKRNFLEGYNVSSTPSVQPNASEMKLIVQCSGGTWKEGGRTWVCVSCSKDQALWPALRQRGARVVSTEFILGGVLKQKIDITSNEFPSR